MDRDDIRIHIDKAFEEMALVLGGIFAVHTVQDEAVWQIMKHIDIIHESLIAKIEGMGSGDMDQATTRHTNEPHPAVEALLLKLRKRNSVEGHES